MNIKYSIIKFFKSFYYALCGIKQCVWCERNFRFHLGAGLIALSLSLIVGLSAGQNALLFILIGLILALEAINSAIERAVDLAGGGEYSKLAKSAKDMSSGAVLIMAVFAVLAGIELFFADGRFKTIIAFFKENIWADITAVITVPLWLAWVLKCDLSDLDKEDIYE